jgi:hypothetical protein
LLKEYKMPQPRWWPLTLSKVVSGPGRRTRWEKDIDKTISAIEKEIEKPGRKRTTRRSKRGKRRSSRK